LKSAQKIREGFQKIFEFFIREILDEAKFGKKSGKIESGK